MKEKLYKGSSKVLYQSSDNELNLIMAFSDSMRNGKGQLVECLGKGIVNNNISSYLMKQLDSIGVENHFIKKSNMYQQLVYIADVYPIRVHITKIASGRYVKEFGIEKGLVFDEPILDFTIKNRELGYPSANEHQIINFGWMTKYELTKIKQMAMRIHDFLSGLFLSSGIRFVDARLEFGRVFDGEEISIMLVDELSPDNCRLWDITTNIPLCYEALDKSPQKLLQAYREVENRLNINSLL